MRRGIPGGAVASARGSWGPSEGLRPPQDDIASVGIYFAFRFR